MAIAIPFWTIQPWPSFGLPVHLIRPQVTLQPVGGLEPLLVYVEGDPAIEWIYVARVVDTIVGLHSQVVLLKR